MSSNSSGWLSANRRRSASNDAHVCPAAGLSRKQSHNSPFFPFHIRSMHRRSVMFLYES